jgi:SNF2 family DNA or RNA helicase
MDIQDLCDESPAKRARTSDDPDKEIPEDLRPLMKQHQKEGFKFMWEHIRKGEGCILADFMGLVLIMLLIASALAE